MAESFSLPETRELKSLAVNVMVAPVTSDFPKAATALIVLSLFPNNARAGVKAESSIRMLSATAAPEMAVFTWRFKGSSSLFYKYGFVFFVHIFHWDARIILYGKSCYFLLFVSK